MIQHRGEICFATDVRDIILHGVTRMGGIKPAVAMPCREPAPYERIERRDEAAHALRCIPKRERRVVWRHCKGQFLREIGEAMGFSEARAHQLFHGGTAMAREALR